MSETKTPPVETVENDSKYTKKITAERMTGGVIPVPAPGETLWLFTIYGDIEKIESGSTTYGPFLRLIGEFIADSYVNGESVTSTSAILPGIAEQVIRNHLATVGFGEPEGPKRVTFAMDIGVDHSKSGERNYTWVVKPVGATRKTPLMMYRDSVKARLKQISALKPSEPAKLEAPTPPANSDGEQKPGPVKKAS